MTVANLLTSLSVNEFWKLVSIWWSCEQKCSIFFYSDSGICWVLSPTH